MKGRITALIAVLAITGAQAADVTACQGLAAPMLFKSATVLSAREVAGDEAAKVPPYCEIIATLKPAPGSAVGVVLRLPDAWNEKLLGLGGGGWAGNVRLDTAIPMVARGYTTAQTDGGHPGTDLWNTDWTGNAAALTDFSWRAVHEMTLFGKAVIARYYGRPQSRAYFQGCSTGGRQGLLEAQRFPTDYDGVVAGAPVHSLLTQTSMLSHTLAFRAPQAALTPKLLARLNEASLAACDAADGLADGIVTDPRACSFDPGTLACAADTTSDDCFTPAQLGALRDVYQPVSSADGRIAAYPLLPGDEAGWPRFVDTMAEQPLGTTAHTAGVKGLRSALFKDGKFDLAAFNAARDLALVRSTPFAAGYEAVNPDLSAFVDRGGKLILWHGFDDPGPSPLATIDYYTSVETALGARMNTLGAPVRLYVAPGMEHCRGGRGATQFDALRALEDWVERKEAPETIFATGRDGKLSRPLCRYPALPRYKGSGDPNDATSFDCR